MSLNISGLFSQSDVRETVTNDPEASVMFDLDYARYDSKFTVANGTGIYLSPDELKMYICTAANVLEYDLSTKGDVSTAVLTNTEVIGGGVSAVGLHFRHDGLKMYIADTNAPESVREYDLTTAWDVSTKSYLQELNVTAQTPSIHGLYFREDGKQMLLGDGGGEVDSYMLATAWDVTTATYTDTIAFVGTRGIAFSRSGEYGFFCKSATTTLYKYKMSTVFKIASAVADGTWEVYPSITPIDIFFKRNGTRLYLLSAAEVQGYSLKIGWR